jgi:acyl CoA:acetate/3-ketoacid CoA transferase
MRDKFISADEAAALVPDGATVALMGGGGGLMEATELFQAIERRFLASGHPRGLTAVHALGIGDKRSRGMNCFAHEGLVRRVIGGHWVWSPRMQQLAQDNRIEAYILPGGVSSQLFRAIGAGAPGLKGPGWRAVGHEQRGQGSGHAADSGGASARRAPCPD